MKLAFAIANIGIFCGYLFISTIVVPNIAVERISTKVGGFFFFLTCGLTHLEQAVHIYDTGGGNFLTSWHMSAVHLTQVIAVWVFIYGLYYEFVVPELRPRK